ncbi:hypothetical protein AN641_04980 [Candidatus Epulonipiscioides gigas]|nr:hypothetical protein AN641_04980 [Epulopiscium sp. SCG-C07WGA-EpuloA2]
MKIEKQNKYYTICVYTVISVVITMLICVCIIKFVPIINWIKEIIGITISILMPLFIGLLLAYLIEPIVDLYIASINAKRLSPPQIRGLATAFSIITVLGLIGIFIIMVVMNIQQVINETDIKGISQTVKAYFLYFQKTADSLVSNLDEGEISKRVQEFLTTIYNTLDVWAAKFSQITIELISNIGQNLIDIVFGIILAIYIIKDKPKLLKIFDNILLVILKEKLYRKATSLGRDINMVLTGYIRGQIIDALIMAALVSIGLSIIGLDFAVIIGIANGILNIVPYFGPVVGLVLTGIIGALGEGPQKAVYAIIIVFIIQQIDGFIIVPKILGNNVKLHPMVVLLAILIGGELYGIAGMLLGVPICALGRVIIIRIVGNVFNENYKPNEKELDTKERVRGEKHR